MGKLTNLVLGALMTGAVITGCNEDPHIRVTDREPFTVKINEVRYYGPENNRNFYFEYCGVSPDRKSFFLDLGSGEEKYSTKLDTLRKSSLFIKRDGNYKKDKDGFFVDAQYLFVVENVDSSAIKLRYVGYDQLD